MSEPILELRDVSLYYGKIRAVDRVSLSVPADSIVGVIGPNGAGKSSLLRAISGVQVRVEGEIRFRGTRIDSLSPDKIVRLGIAHCPEGSQLFPEMSVKENLLMGAFTRRSRSDVQEGLTETFALFPILEERQTQQAGHPQRRGTADARDRAESDGQAPAPDVGRAVAGAFPPPS